MGGLGQCWCRRGGLRVRLLRSRRTGTVSSCRLQLPGSFPCSFPGSRHRLPPAGQTPPPPVSLQFLSPLSQLTVISDSQELPQTLAMPSQSCPGSVQVNFPVSSIFQCLHVCQGLALQHKQQQTRLICNSSWPGSSSSNITCDRCSSSSSNLDRRHPSSSLQSLTRQCNWRKVYTTLLALLLRF